MNNMPQGAPHPGQSVLGIVTKLVTIIVATFAFAAFSNPVPVDQGAVKSAPATASFGYAASPAAKE